MLFDDIVNSCYTGAEYPALGFFSREWAFSRPFAGLRILVATPVFRNTLLQYRALLAGGANLIVGVANSGEDGAGAEMPCDPGVVDLLRENGIPVIGVREALEMESRCAGGHGFDLVLDCAGQFAKLSPKFGFVELTRSGVQFYEGSGHPVYVADSGLVKRIETSLGTGEGYVRALRQLGYASGNSGADAAGAGNAFAGGDDAAEFSGKKFVVFGSGKVGQGIVLQLFSTGRGTPYGLQEIPVFKICTQHSMKQKWPDLFDLDAGPVVTGEKTIAELGHELYGRILDVLEGEKTCAEKYGLYNDFIVFNPAPIT